MSIFIDKVLEAGGSMAPLAICSVISIAVIIERAVALKRKNIIDDDLIIKTRDAVGRGDYAAAQAAGKNSETVLGTIIDKGIDNHLVEHTELEEALSESSARELPKLEKFLNVLALIGSIAPLLGLFGTVYGMILSFDEIAKESVDKELMAKGISVALITTGTGLIIAIPAIIANNYYRARVEGFYRSTEDAILAIMRAYHISKDIDGAASTVAEVPSISATSSAATGTTAEEGSDNG